MIETIDPQDIIELNKKFSSGTLLRKGLDAIYSSYFYYETKEEQICSIFQNLIKGHYFTDGNKRISALVLVTLIGMNGMQTPLTNENLDKVTLKIAESNLSVEEISRMIF